MTLSEKAIELEKLLMTPAARKSVATIDELLADDFLEFGGSGMSFGKSEAIEWLPEEDPERIIYEGYDFECRVLSDELFQVIYKLKILENDAGIKYSLRSSIWKKQGNHLKMLFHQATPVINIDK